MLAFKGFTKDLTCIRGEGIFRYEPGVLYTADVYDRHARHT